MRVVLEAGLRVSPVVLDLDCRGQNCRRKDLRPPLLLGFSIARLFVFVHNIFQLAATTARDASWATERPIWELLTSLSSDTGFFGLSAVFRSSY